MIVKYLLNSTTLVEPIEVEYTKGIISGIKMPVKHPLNLDQYEYLIAFVPFYEKNIEGKVKLGNKALYITKEVGANIKVSMFCSHYMIAHPGLKYTATKQDGNKIRVFKITDQILDHYFKSDNFLFKTKHSISNLVQYYNQLIAEINDLNKNKHPDFWAEKYENKLRTQQEISEYWAHLRGLGLEPKKDRVGKTIDWVKKQ